MKFGYCPVCSMQELKFKNVDDKIYPDKQFVNSFYVSGNDFASNKYELRTLTIHNLIYASIRNELRVVYFKALKILYNVGFMDLTEGEIFCKDKLTYKFWKVLRKRRNLEYTRGLIKHASKSK